LRKVPRGRAIVAALTVVSAAIALTGCVSNSGSSNGGSSNGSSSDKSTLTLALSATPPSLDPAQQQSAGDSLWRWHAVYDTLLRCDQNGEVGPAAAKSWTLSDNATKLTMVLRSGMKFSDGSPVNAAAAKASIEHMQNGGGSDSGRVKGMTVATPDGETVVVTAPKPTGQLPMFMCFAPGIIASPAQLTSSDVGTTPISSGPYTLDLTKTTTGSVYTYHKRADYWDAKSYPYQNLVLKVMPEVTARLNALKSAQIQGAIIDQASSAEASSSGLHVITHLGNWSGLFINDRAGAVVPALGDVRVRRAINMVFDRAAIAKGLYGGDAQVTTQIFTPDETAYEPSLDEKYAYNLKEAKALMAEAGYANGFDVQIPNWAPDSAKVNPMVEQQLALLNIRAKEVTLSGPTALNKILSGSFPIFAGGLSTGGSLFDIVQSLAPDSIWNVMHSSDPALQPLLDQAQVLQGTAAAADYKKISAYVVDQAWFAPWVAGKTYFALSSANLAPTQTDQFHLIPELWDFR
jgi:peptide/nickel transport system substrate-binding protein